MVGTAGGVFESFGSIFGKGKEAAKGVQEALGGKTHSAAYAEGLDEVKAPVQALSTLRPLDVYGRLLERERRFVRRVRAQRQRGARFQTDPSYGRTTRTKAGRAGSYQRHGCDDASSSSHVCEMRS